MAANLQQIQDLLGTGLSPDTVASAVGVSESYISQLMSDEVFAAVVIEKRSKALTANNKRDLSIDAIEDKLISKLNDLIPYMMKPNEVLNAFRTMNSAKRRGVQPIHQATQRQQVVVLNVQPRVRQQFRLSMQNEIIDHGEQTLVTMDSHTLLKKLADQNKDSESGDKYRQLASRIRTEESNQ